MFLKMLEKDRTNVVYSRSSSRHFHRPFRQVSLTPLKWVTSSYRQKTSMRPQIRTEITSMVTAAVLMCCLPRAFRKNIWDLSFLPQQFGAGGWRCSCLPVCNFWQPVIPCSKIREGFFWKTTVRDFRAHLCNHCLKRFAHGKKKGGT